MTKYSRILVVFLTAASLAFMGFAAAARYGGTNWQAESRAAGLADYEITEVVGETTSYQVKYRRGNEETVATTPVLAEAVTKAYQHATNTAQQQLGAITSEIPQQQARLATTNTLNAIDDKALGVRVGELQQAASALESQITTLSNTLTQKSRRTFTTRAEVADRREDVLRLTDELENLRTDLSRLRDLEKLLVDRLIRLKSLNQSLDERKDQLLRQGGQQDGGQNPELPPVNASRTG